MKLKRKILSIVMALSMLVGTLAGWASQAHAESKDAAGPKFNIGDYVQFASYNGAPILWKVVDFDDEGDPMIYSEYIVCIKAFDAAGDKHEDIYWNGQMHDNRREGGSNEWETSTLRQWLNSADESINWVKNPPSDENMFLNRNGYDSEKGFMADGNFTADERSAIKPVTHRVELSDIDKDKSDGVEALDGVYYSDVTDSVFVLSEYEQDSFLNQGIIKYRAKPSPELIGSYQYGNQYWSAVVEYGTEWDSWLRNPYLESSTAVMFSGSVGGMLEVRACTAGDSEIGVIPACYLEMDSIKAAAGSGTKSDPYVITDIGTGLTDFESVQKDMEAIQIGYTYGDDQGHVRGDISLNTKGGSGTEISWKSSEPSVVSSSGAVSRPDKDTPVVLTATVSKSGASDSRTFTITVLKAQLNRGDYVQFGSYDGQPILWKVINIDEDLGPLLCSNNILCNKAFDAPGYKRDKSDEWENSNIRQWLNSDEQSIDWTGNTPNANNLIGCLHPYSDESGFLSDGNFSAGDRSAIKSVSHKVLLSKSNIEKKDGGNELYPCDIYAFPKGVLQGYDSAYYRNVTDRVFFLSTKQNEEYVVGNKFELEGPVGENEEFWANWLATPYTKGFHGYNVIEAATYGRYEDAYVDDETGVRPALYMDMDSIKLGSGVGSKASPYIAIGTGSGNVEYFEGNTWPSKKTTDPQKTWTVEFSKQIDTSSVNSDSIYIASGQGDKMPCTLKPLPGGKAVEVTPIAEYEPSKTYYIYVKKGVVSMGAEGMKSNIRMPFVYEP